MHSRILKCLSECNPEPDAGPKPARVQPSNMYLQPVEPGGIVVISGGTATNSLVDVFARLADDQKCRLNYVLPISDNGGSSSEITRVLGGPAIGDIRSRLVRLIPDQDPTSDALKLLFNHRLPSNPAKARAEWHELIECRHPAWLSIPSDQRELIRPFLNLVNLEITKRARPMASFCFQDASLGNLFLTGARLFTGSLEAAIRLLKVICGVPDNIDVLPIINTNHSVNIAATLRDGSTIIGQNAISHPSVPAAEVRVGEESPLVGPESVLSTAFRHQWVRRREQDEEGRPDTALPGSLPALHRQNIAFSKERQTEKPLSSHIHKIWYINPYGQRIHPIANPRATVAIRQAACVVYSIGSLFTSLLPCLIAGGVSDAVAKEPSSLLKQHQIRLGKRKRTTSGSGSDSDSDSDPVPFLKSKILLLNRSQDRETAGGNDDEPMSLEDICQAIDRAVFPSGHDGEEIDLYPVVTDVLYLDTGDIEEELGGQPRPRDAIRLWNESKDRMKPKRAQEMLFCERYGISVHSVKVVRDGNGDLAYDPENLLRKMKRLVATAYD